MFLKVSLKVFVPELRGLFLGVGSMHGRIIHEAGEAEASRPGPRLGPGPPGAKQFLERKFAVL